MLYIIIFCLLQLFSCSFIFHCCLKSVVFFHALKHLIYKLTILFQHSDKRCCLSHILFHIISQFNDCALIFFQQGKDFFLWQTFQYIMLFSYIFKNRLYFFSLRLFHKCLHITTILSALQPSLYYSLPLTSLHIFYKNPHNLL